MWILHNPPTHACIRDLDPVQTSHYQSLKLKSGGPGTCLPLPSHADITRCWDFIHEESHSTRGSSYVWNPTSSCFFISAFPSGWRSMITVPHMDEANRLLALHTFQPPQETFSSQLESSRLYLVPICWHSITQKLFLDPAFKPLVPENEWLQYFCFPWPVCGRQVALRAVGFCCVA